MEQCNRYLEWLSAQLDNEITPEETRELEQHLARCPDCNTLAQELAMIHTAFPQLEELAAPEGFAQGVMEKIQAQEGQKNKVMPLFKRPQFRALAGLAACAVLCVGLYRGGQFSADSGEMTGHDQPAGMGIAAASAGSEPEMRMGSAPADVQGDADVQLDAVAPQISAFGVPGEELPTQPTIHSADGSGPYQVAGQNVSAILTLSQLPDGAEELLGQEVPWTIEEDGQVSCLVTGQQLQALLQLAQGQEDISTALVGQAEDEELCAVILLP